MLYYGFALDSKRYPDEAFNDKNMHTCYSVSSYDPTSAVYGVKLFAGSCLFDPIKLDDILEKTTGNLPVVELPQNLKKYLIDKHQSTPTFYLFETSDD